MKCVVIIPALNPDKKLITLVEKLKKLGLDNIIVVDDGSSIKDNLIFDYINVIGCKVCHHEVNKGKGEAIRTGIRANNEEDISGYITVDADGQHLPKDIFNIAKELEKNQNNIILGTRNFENYNVPLRSKLGNKISSILFKLQTGVSCSDTQTGLRGIPKKYKELALITEGDRYDYEMNFLINAAKCNVKFTKIYIETIYEDKNKNSHFRPIRDSFLIFKDLFRFIGASLISSIMDICIFSLIAKIIFQGDITYIFIATAIARILSGILNFILNKKWSFESKDKIEPQIVKYSLLFISQMIISALAVTVVVRILNLLILSKVIVDFSLFIISYFIQKNFIFTNKSKLKEGIL